MRVGVFGGSFDPIHSTHIDIAVTAQSDLHLDHVLFVPAAMPPHKPNHILAENQDRVAMIQLAIGQNPFFQLSDIELKRKGPSYTVDTLRELQKRMPPYTELFLIMGEDSLRDFHTWHKADEIRNLATLVVARRKGINLSSMDDKRVCFLKNQPNDVASSQVREAIALGKPEAQAMVPDVVWDYIQTHGLYGSKSKA